MKKIFFILVSLLFLNPFTNTCTTQSIQKSKSSNIRLNKAWPTSLPEEQEMDSRKLARAVEYILENDKNVHSMTIIRNGYIVLDVNFYPYQSGMKHDIASATKSIMSTLIGIAINKNFIKDVKQPVMVLFPEYKIAKLKMKKKKMTIEDLLTMQSGLRWGENDISDLFKMMASPDWIQYILDLPIDKKPGKRFLYNSGAVHLLSEIIRVTTGMNASNFASKYLFEPLGITDVIWPDDSKGINSTGWGGIRIKPHDMAKIGYLYLNNGEWEDQKIISPSWIEMATRKNVKFKDGKGYGYLWWLQKDNVFCALGRGGQFLYNFPDEKMIVNFTGGGSSSSPAKIRFIKKYILTAIYNSDKSLPENDEGIQILKQYINLAAKTPDNTPIPYKLPAIADQISGNKYILEPNQFGVLSFILTINNKKEAIFKMDLAIESDRNPEFKVGLDDIPRLSEGRFGIPASAKGFWSSDNKFTIILNEIGNINRFEIEFFFNDNNVRFNIYDKTGLGGTSVNGKCKI